MNHKTESLDQFLARGGTIEVLPAGEAPRATQVSLQELEKLPPMERGRAKMNKLKMGRSAAYSNIATPHLA